MLRTYCTYVLQHHPTLWHTYIRPYRVPVQRIERAHYVGTCNDMQDTHIIIKRQTLTLTCFDPSVGFRFVPVNPRTLLDRSAERRSVRTYVRTYVPYRTRCTDGKTERSNLSAFSVETRICRRLSLWLGCRQCRWLTLRAVDTLNLQRRHLIVAE